MEVFIVSPQQGALFDHISVVLARVQCLKIVLSSLTRFGLYLPGDTGVTVLLVTADKTVCLICLLLLLL